MENTDELLQINIHSILPSTSEETVNGVIQIVKEAGLETLSDLQFVEDDDLTLVLSPIQRRKLVKAWRDQSPLELEKSGDALATNRKIVEETLSRRSENSPHNKLNTDIYDPQTSIAASIRQGEKRSKSLLRESYTESATKTQQLPSSKAEEKINKSFMQNNCGQNQNIYHNTGIGSCHYYLNAQNSFTALKRFGNVSLDDKLLLFSSRGEDTKLIIPSLPETDRLMEVHFARYKQRLLDKTLDYSRIVIDPCLEEGSSRIASRTLYEYDPMNQWKQSNGSRLSDLVTIENFKKGIGLLKLGYEKEGKIEMKKAADRGLPHAKYVYAIIMFKEIVQHHRDSKFKLPPKKDIDEAFIYMLHIERVFFPLPSFVLGIMQSYNQISVSKQLAGRVVASPREYLKDVLRGIRYSEGNYNLIALNKYTVMEDENGEYLKWMAQSSKFEFAKGMLLCPEGLPGAKSLLQELSLDGFADAKCLYALALLKNAFGDMQIFKKSNFDQAYTLLEEAIYHGLKEAMFFFGILPFRKEFELLDKKSLSREGKFCFGYLGKYLEICGKDGEFKKDAAILIAAEYLKERYSFVTYDERMAKAILRENDCDYELQELEEKLKERKERANDVLPDVLDVLKQVHNDLEKNREPSAQQLSSKVKELLTALRGSGLIVQKSPLLLSTLQLIHISSTMGHIFLLAPLQQLYNVLESQVVSQPHRFLQKEVLLSLRDLYETCITLQMQRIRNVSHT